MNRAFFTEYPLKYLQDHILTRSIPEPNSGCWLWIGYYDKDGYGATSFHGRKAKGHRVSFAAFRPEDFDNSLHVLHKCDAPPCVNPDHLFLGTALDNSRDKIKKGRHYVGDRRGERSIRAILSKAQVREIRSGRRNVTWMRKKAEEWGVTTTSIHGAYYNKHSWSEVGWPGDSVWNNEAALQSQEPK